MSGGGSVPKAPDLSGNISNANDTFKTATANAAQTMNTADTYNKNAQSNLTNVVNQSNSMAGQIGANASTNLNTYGSSFVPLQAQQAQQAQDYTSEANINKLKGMAVADSNSANQAARAISAARLAAAGVDPNSIHGAALDRQAGVQGAAQVAGAATNSVLNTENTGRQLVANANQLGLQVGQAGTQAGATAAGVGQAGQQTMNATNNAGVSNLTAANTYLNTGVNANNSAMSGAQDQFGDQMQQYNAQQAQSAGALSSIGTIAGAAAMFMEDGGSVPHSGLPVHSAGVKPRGIPLHFEPMDAGGHVTTKGALPTGTFPGTTDRKPAMLTPGEFVIPHDVASFMGQEKLHKLIDKAHEDMNKRRAIPVNHPPHMSMN
jgi:hypothetical protein